MAAEANRLSAGLSARKRKTHVFHTVLTILLFIPGAFLFWEFLYEFCNMIGSIASGTPYQALIELRRMLPLILTAFTMVYFAVYVFDACRAGSAAKSSRYWHRCGIIGILLGAVIAVYVPVGVIMGLYHGFVESNPSLLYPLDICLGGVLIAVFGAASAAYAKKQSGIFVSCGVRGHFRVFHVISYLFAMCGFVACIRGTFVMDWHHGYLFYNVMLWLNYFTAFAMAVVYRFVYCESRQNRRPAIARGFGLGFLIVNAVLLGLLLTATQLQNEAPNLNAFGLLPIEFTANIAAFPILYGLNNLIAPLAALLGSFRKKK